MIFFLVMDNPREVWRKIQEREGQIKKHAMNFDAGQQIEEHTYCASTLSEFLDNTDVICGLDLEDIIVLSADHLVRGLNLVKYLEKVDLVINPEKARLKMIASDGGEYHKLSEEDKMLQLYNVLKVDKIDKDLTDVIGQEKAKKILMNIAVHPWVHGHLMENTKTIHAVLLHGASGTAKTTLAMGAAKLIQETGGKVFQISSSRIKSSWHGETEKNIGRAFKICRANAPCVIFWDEAEQLCSKRSEEDERGGAPKIKQALLEEMELNEEQNRGLMMIAATNLPQNMDEGHLRRYEQTVYVSMPTHKVQLNFPNSYSIVISLIIYSCRKLHS